MFNSSIFVKKMWALKNWCVTKVAHCIFNSTSLLIYQAIS